MSYSGLGVSIEGRIISISDPEIFQHRISTDAFPPVMSYFEPLKRSTAGQSFLNQERVRFASIISSAKKVVVIGVKIREHDLHIWEPIQNTNAQFIYCC